MVSPFDLLGMVDKPALQLAYSLAVPRMHHFWVIFIALQIYAGRVEYVEACSSIYVGLLKFSK